MKIWKKPNKRQPWALSKDALENIIEIAQAQEGQKEQKVTPEAIASTMAEQLDNTFAASVINNVAVLPVVGPLFRYSNLFSFFTGSSTYERLAHDFTQAVNNPEIKSIVLDIDSPGGEVNGCAELATLIFEARGTKPIIAYASGDCASGAYWIASAADQIVASDTASLGSLGVVAIYQNKEASEDIEIVSSQSPFKRLDPSIDADKEKIQQRIDALANVFITAVATHRNVSIDTVKNEFGQGDIFIGQTAIERGLADSGGTLDKILNQLSNTTTENNSQNERNENPPRAGFFMPEGNSMDLKEIREKYPACAQQLISEGITKERERISAIFSGDETQGREVLAQHLAFNTDLTAEVIQVALKQSPVPNASPEPVDTPPTPEQTSGFADVMASLGNPDVQVSGSQDDETEEAVIARIAGYSVKAGGQ